MNLEIDAGQAQELRAAVDERVSSLGKLHKKLEDAGLSTDECEARLAILRGDDTTTGLRQLLSDQVYAFEAAGNGANVNG